MRWAPKQSAKTDNVQLTKFRTETKRVNSGEDLLQEYLKILARKCNTLGGLDVGPRLTLERIYIGREFQKQSDQANPNDAKKLYDDELLKQGETFILIEGNAGFNGALQCHALIKASGLRQFCISFL